MVKRAKLRKTLKEEQPRRDKVDISGAAEFFKGIAMRHPLRSDLVFVCIGTDRSTGDSLGPWVGTLLQEQGWPSVIGTLERPCDANHYEEAVAGIPSGRTVIAIDACLGGVNSPSRYLVAHGPLLPGRAAGLRLTPVGHYSLGCIVGPMSVKPYRSLQQASLFQVMGMAREIAETIREAWNQFPAEVAGQSRFDGKDAIS
ncbi:spore protease YyaC [Paenibacillus nasutitermitis]|uniref:Spore protease YyaC n=1 Tax=Paenibacillus nasutitermitis TaxID=1652958 RepID=A0A916Z4C3_9BACL|nr:spore protease YyaC [Paenibacillus nasutitermitis]GGD75809.1 hypothetical protein GCM10010911_37280 [Paenibacillus nasutitermitis]